MTPLTDEQQAFAEAIRAFCAHEDFPRDVPHHDATWQKLARLGWLGVVVPEEHGGSGGGAVDMVLLLDELAAGAAPVNGIGTTFIVAGAYGRYGTEEQKATTLSGIAGGDVVAIAMSEPGAGSDVGGLICRAERRDGVYIVNGQKTWVSNAHLAAKTLLVCRTSREGTKHEGLTMLEVPRGVDGLEVRPIDTMGGREVNDLFFTDCAIPVEHRLGEEGNGWRQLMAGLNHERLIAAGQALGMARWAFATQLKFVKEREQFGRPVGSFQVLKHRIADLATEIECTSLLVYDLARRADANPGAIFPREASMAKLKASEVAKRAALEGMQNMGGYGYATEYEMERQVRNALATSIFAGTNEIQREIIGRSYGL